MLKVGLTGGIAAGKSVVGEMFVALGAQLVQADRIAHSLMQPGEPVYNEVVRHFGREILNPRWQRESRQTGGGGVWPARSPAGKRERRAIEELNRIVHPAVIRSQEEWMEEMGGRIRTRSPIVEAALILEAGAGKRFDRLVVVTCSAEQRVARFAARQKIDLEAARKGSCAPHGGAAARRREDQSCRLCDRQLRLAGADVASKCLSGMGAAQGRCKKP